MSINEMIAKGYRRVSRKGNIVSRIDRPDWKNHPSLNKHLSMNGEAQDWYRRVLSKDTLTIGTQAARLIPTSNGDPIGFIE